MQYIRRGALHYTGDGLAGEMECNGVLRSMMAWCGCLICFAHCLILIECMHGIKRMVGFGVWDTCGTFAFCLDGRQARLGRGITEFVISND